MYPTKTIICLLCCLSLFACSSTEQVGNQYFSDNGYAQGFINNNFTQTKFSPINKNSIKKPLSSDHQLMMSLLNRPMTADQSMMLAFAQQRASYATPFVTTGVAIKGKKENDNNTARTIHLYAHLIEQDINAVTITAPPQ
ncbi:MAG: hypothetical protein OQK09_04640 [Colwellia sp.]|nr:hypothetical protein [Colwellia sp.]MCW8866002.1 hypothetical protein [Colwellia sp.]MCW9080776.1 hypothetical protein [Colwellia sp.]